MKFLSSRPWLFAAIVLLFAVVASAALAELTNEGQSAPAQTDGQRSAAQHSAHRRREAGGVHKLSLPARSRWLTARCC
jgi:anti-sigma factor RsiW